MPSGKKCHSPPPPNKTHCYYHTSLDRLGDAASRETKPLPPIENASGIQIALTQVLGALNSPHMDTRRAGLLLYGLQIATQLTTRVSAPEPSESVRSLSENNGDVLAPETITCEPAQDCCKCPDWESCEKLERADEDEFEEVEEEDDGD